MTSEEVVAKIYGGNQDVAIPGSTYFLQHPIRCSLFNKRIYAVDGYVTFMRHPSLWQAATDEPVLDFNGINFSLSGIRVQGDVGSSPFPGVGWRHGGWRPKELSGGGTVCTGVILNDCSAGGFVTNMQLGNSLPTSNSAGTDASEHIFNKFTISNCNQGILASGFNTLNIKINELNAPSTCGAGVVVDTASEIHINGGSFTQCGAWGSKGWGSTVETCGGILVYRAGAGNSSLQNIRAEGCGGVIVRLSSQAVVYGQSCLLKNVDSSGDTGFYAHQNDRIAMLGGGNATIIAENVSLKDQRAFKWWNDNSMRIGGIHATYVSSWDQGDFAEFVGPTASDGRHKFDHCRYISDVNDITGWYEGNTDGPTS